MVGHRKSPIISSNSASSGTSRASHFSVLPLNQVAVGTMQAFPFPGSSLQSSVKPQDSDGPSGSQNHPTGEYFQFSFFFRVHLTVPAEGIGPDPDRRNGSLPFLHDGMVLFDQRPSSSTTAVSVVVPPMSEITKSFKPVRLQAPITLAAGPDATVSIGRPGHVPRDRSNHRS